MKNGMLLMMVGLMGTMVCAETPEATYRPSLFKRFGEFVNVPDGLSQDAGGNVFLSAPNLLNASYPGAIMKRCKKTGKWTVFATGLLNPKTRRCAPMGIEVGPDGNVYYCDNQYFFDKDYQSRIIRIVVDKEGEPLYAEPLVEHIKLANAVRVRGNEIFFTDTQFDLPGGVNRGGVYRVPLADCARGPVKLLDKDQAEKDPYCLGFTETQVLPYRRDRSGADGMCFDAKGNIYVGTFGDAHFYTLERQPSGGYAKPRLLYHDASVWPCCDGICYYAKKNWIIMTDSERNAVRYWDIAAKKLGLIWQNPDDDGASGLLDQPCEPMVWDGDKLIVVNFDMTFDGLWNKTNDSIHTLSVIDLGK
jgi:hypothetical protein